MLTIEEIEKRLEDRNLRHVARGAGLSYMTVWRVARGKVSQVSYETVRRLSEYLTANQ